MLDWSQCPVVERLPEKVSGAWLFKGTRVPVKALFENLESGARVASSWNCSRGHAQPVDAVLEHAQRSLIGFNRIGSLFLDENLFDQGTPRLCGTSRRTRR